MDATPAARLLRAAREGDVATFEHVLSLAYVPVDCADEVGDTALSLASQKGHLAVVEALLAHGASVLGADRDGDTALMCACCHGFTEIVAKLLAAGAAVNHVNNDRVTALMCAAENGHAQVVDVLLLAGATVDEVDKVGDSALMCALIEGYEDVVRCLLAAGADVRLCNFRGETPFSRAQRKGQARIVELLQAHEASSNAILAPLEADRQEDVESILKAAEDRNAHGTTLAYMAAMTGRLEILKLLAHHNASLRAKNDATWAPLHASCETGQLDCVRFLLECGVEMDAVDKQGLAPIDVGARNGHFEVVRELHRRGASLQNVARSGETILHQAVVSQQLALVVFLTQQPGIDMNATDICGWTPLHYAVEAGNSAITSVLLLRGADPSRKITASRDASDVVSELRLSSTALHMAVYIENIEIITILFATGQIEVNARDADGRTPLYLAVALGSSRVAATLVQLGADVHVQNFSGESPLSIGIQSRDESMSKLFLDHTNRVPSQVAHRCREESRFVEIGDAWEALVELDTRDQASTDVSLVVRLSHTGENDRTDDESDTTLCQHRGGGVCREPRTTKINGAPHKLCHLHRIKQNEKKRRSSMKHKDSDAPHPSPKRKRAEPQETESAECQYAGRPCSQPRDFKPNGELHLFCKQHRFRHNSNQRSVHIRRRQRTGHEVDGSTIHRHAARESS